MSQEPRKFKIFDTVKKEFVDDETFFIWPNGKLAIMMLGGSSLADDVLFKIIYSTGLKDYEGKDVYQGDIDENRNVVEWDIILGAFILNQEGYPLLSNCLSTQIIKIIGSSLTNPEFLKQ